MLICIDFIQMTEKKNNKIMKIYFIIRQNRKTKSPYYAYRKEWNGQDAYRKECNDQDAYRKECNDQDAYKKECNDQDAYRKECNDQESIQLPNTFSPRHQRERKT